MKHAAQVILSPVITEKSTDLKEKARILCFRVAKKAGKIEIKKAVEQLFKVKVAQVRTMNTHGKWVRRGRYIGQKPGWKKAYVTLAEDQKMIEYFEGS